MWYRYNLDILRELESFVPIEFVNRGTGIGVCWCYNIVYLDENREWKSCLKGGYLIFYNWDRGDNFGMGMYRPFKQIPNLILEYVD